LTVHSSRPPFIVCPYMKNGHIIHFLSLYPNKNRVKLVHQIALGMLYLHGKGIIHGNLKPTNVLIDDSEEACITGFGLSSIDRDDGSDTSVSTQETPGVTLRWMSPEALEGYRAQSSDVYAYGMSLYNIFTNEAPFVAIPWCFISRAIL